MTLLPYTAFGQPSLAVQTPESAVVVTATSVAEGIVVDGRLDEPVYDEVAPVSDFIQQEPRPGRGEGPPELGAPTPDREKNRQAR